MKLKHRITGTILAIAFATTTALPAAGIPNLKTPAAIKAATPPRVVAPPRVVTPPVIKAPVTPKIPNVPKVPVKTPVVPKVPAVVKAPVTPKIPAIKTPMTPRVVKAPVTAKAPTTKIPAIVSSPKAPRAVKAPVTVKAPDQTTIVKAPAATKPSPVFTSGKNSSKDNSNTLASVTSAPPPDTRVTIQGGNSSNSNSSQNTSTNTEATEVLVDQLQNLGFSEAEAQKIAAQLQDPATRAAAQKVVEGKSSAEATRQMISGLVGEEQAADIARRLTDPATRAKTEQNLKLVVEMAANLQLTGVSPEKADRVAVNLIRNGVTDPKIINEIAGRLIATDVLGVPPPPPADPDDPTAPTALDLIKVAINVQADLQAIGAAPDGEEVKKATEEILKNRITDPKKIKEILEKAATPILEEQGLPPGKPGESLKDRLNRFAEQQKAELEAAKPKKDAPKKPNKPSGSVSLGTSFKGRFGRLFGHKPGEGGPTNPNGRSPTLSELVFGTTQPSKGGPRGVKDGTAPSGGVNGGNGPAGAGLGAGNGGQGAGGVVGGPHGNVQGDKDQGVGTGTSPARDPDPSPVRDPNRDPNQPVDGDPNGTGGRGGNGAGGPADPNATGNADVAEQDLPDSTNPQQSGNATDPAGSNMDTNNGTFTVTSDPAQNADGTTTVAFSVSGSPGGGNDGNYETTYYPDGTYVTNRINENGDPEYVGEGNGTPPAVKAGDSTNVTNGDQAVFAGDDTSGSESGSNSDSNSSSSSSGDSNGGGGENSSDSSNSDDSSNDDNNSNGDSDTQHAEDDDSTESAGRPAPDGEGRRSAKDAANDPAFWSRVSALFGKKSGGDPNTTNPGRGDNENPVFDRSVPITDKKAGLIGNPTGTSNRPRPAIDRQALPTPGNNQGTINPDRNDNPPPTGEDKSGPLPPKPGGGV